MGHMGHVETPANPKRSQQDSLADELAEMSPSVLLDFVRGLMRQWERTSVFHAQACDREDAAVALAAQWQERYEQAQSKLDAIGRLALGIEDGAR